MAKKFETFTFPKGEALFARLDQPYKFSKRDKRTVECKATEQGAEYSIAVKLSMKDATPIIKKIKEVWKETNADDQPKNWPFKNETDRESGEPTGNVLFKTKFKANFENKDGSYATVPLFDAKGHKLPQKFEIGNGSIIRVGVQFVPYDVDMNGGGVSLRLKGVQVIKPNGGNGFDSMFNEEDGFEASDSQDDEADDQTSTSSSTEDDDEIPF